MFMDGASAHSLKGLKVPDNMTIEKIPPYSPDVNPSENIWDEIREKFSVILFLILWELLRTG